MESNQQKVSELRQDLVSGDWVVMASKRGRRPEVFEDKKCPFCPANLKSQEIICQNKKVIVIKNKFPAFKPQKGLNKRHEGPFLLMDGVGFQEVIILKDHNRELHQLSLAEMTELIKVYQERYLELMNEEHINYIAIFHNKGQEAGASIKHPHSQIIAAPVIDPDVKRSLAGSYKFNKRYNRCVHCVMIEHERKSSQRMLFENDEFCVFVPFVSRVAYEVRVFPIKHRSYFERMTAEERPKLAEALKNTLEKLYKGIEDPPYNFFLHTAPCDGRNYDHYHWHFEILPKTSIWAGFELGAGIEICSMTPEQAAEVLQKV